MYKIYQDVGDTVQTELDYIVIGPSGRSMYLYPSLSLEEEVANFASEWGTYPTIDAIIAPIHQRYIAEVESFEDAYNAVKLLSLMG